MKHKLELQKDFVVPEGRQEGTVYPAGTYWAFRIGKTDTERAGIMLTDDKGNKAKNIHLANELSKQNAYSPKTRIVKRNEWQSIIRNIIRHEEGSLV